ncbi:MAG: cytochrome b/b6 domain-containing protein [Anaerolineales bacterium]
MTGVKLGLVWKKSLFTWVSRLFFLMALIALAVQPAAADEPDLHPNFPLLNEAGENVLDSGGPISTMQTCKSCHDTEFIEKHSFHSDVGLSSYGPPGSTLTGRPWDTSPGLFGNWNPIMYRYLSPDGDERVDLTTPEWLQLFGARHAGGGPAVTSREGEPLADLKPQEGNPETNIVDSESGELVPWDWGESGVVEMNCFLCHTYEPDNTARIETLHKGDFSWANTATLSGSGIVEKNGDQWEWNKEAFTDSGEVKSDYIRIQEPSNENCGLCHGLVHVDAQTPLVMYACTPEQWSTITTGQIFSPQRISTSGLNIADKEKLNRSWDIHAERVLRCTDCHYSLNNPVYYQESGEKKPESLLFDPRRIDLGEYLYRPLHQFAKGQSAQGSLAPELDNTLRRCESCHSIQASHDWLPYKERHTQALSCESCHVPKMYAPARLYYDWTVLKPDYSPQVNCRGMQGQGDTFSEAFITGFEPVLLPRDNGLGGTSLTPHNIISSWFWVYGDPPRPVSQRDLSAVWLVDGSYPEEILEIFDKNANGELETAELVIDNQVKENLIKSRLVEIGLDNPRIQGEIQPYSINHTVTHEGWAIKDCRTCHSDESRINAPMLLSDRLPGGVMPDFVSDPSVSMAGILNVSETGELYYLPRSQGSESGSSSGFYILGHDHVDWVDRLGALIFLATLAGIMVHAGFRFFSTRRRAHLEPELEQVYMYTVYERLWHWLQTALILGLIFTGLIIHKPDIFGIFSFRYVVLVHNVLAFILVANAALAAFYHLASGEIKQFIPEPHGFFNQTILQAKYYLNGIFHGEKHPVEKTPERKLNPLQQVTYIAILNILLPLQILTGIFMWGAQRWPEIVVMLGGLPFLAPFHTLVAWLFASFVVLHVYLTTTGHSATAGIKSMIMGWEELESHTNPIQEELTGS